MDEWVCEVYIRECYEVEGLVSRIEDSCDRPLVVSDLGCLCGCPVTVGGRDG